MIKQENEEIYHSNTSLSNSFMTLLLQCPAIYRYKIDHIEDKENEPETFLLGSLFHAMTLEPDDYLNRYREKKYLGTTKQGKAEAAEAKEKGITLIRSDMWNTAKKMSEAVKKSPIFQNFSDNLFTEVSVYWNETVNDMVIPCKARIDGLFIYPSKENEKIAHGVILDLKSASDSSPEHFAKVMGDFGYHRQAAWYKHALLKNDIFIDDFYFLVVEKTPPYVLTHIKVSSEAEIVALDEIKTALNLLQKCLANNYWPSYVETKEVVTVELPKYYLSKGN